MPASNDLSDWGDDKTNGNTAWKLTREKVLMYAGLVIIGASFINSELLGGVFHREYLIAGLALCGISITTWIDRRGR